jgi:nucleoside-diphosphate-sugar epimerase
MRILITGNMGYVGPVLVAHLRHCLPASQLIGFDSGLFASCVTASGALPERRLNTQHFGDMREFPEAILRGVDAVVHLAGVSNDPIGNRFENVTDEINRAASIRLAQMAAEAGVGRFVFASSCSVYGAAEGDARKETDPLNPLTAYARSKVMTEQALEQMDARGMTITSLRFATACGMSDRLRLDLVLNDFVAAASMSGSIAVLSDGTPWRPLIDVRDMARAIEWAISRTPEKGGHTLIVNVGTSERNHRIRELAEAVAAELPGTSISINEAALPDARSYRVDFSLFEKLAPRHQPQCTLQDSIRSLIEGIRATGIRDQEFRNSAVGIRLNTVSALINAGLLDHDLRWRY